MSPWLEILTNALGAGLMLCLKVFLIVTPIFVGYEIAKSYGLFERRWPGLDRVMGPLGFSRGSLVPLLAGLFLGLVYGAGILISVSQEEGLGAEERLALAVFLVTCHSVIEDVAIFVLLGGSAFWMLAPRVLLAVLLSAFLARRRVSRLAAD